MASTPDKPGFRARSKQIAAVFSMTRKQDPVLVPLLLAAFLAPVAVAVVVCLLVGLWATVLPIGVVVGLVLAMVLFTRRSTKAMYAQVEGQPGAAAAVLDSMRGDWRVTPAVQVSTGQDLVHRVLGRPGVVLVGEGNPQRLKGLIGQEMKRVARVTGGVEIYRVVVGDGEGQVTISKLQQHFLRLPRNLTGKQVNALEKRMVAIAGPNVPIPKGPMPKGARPR